MNTYRRVAIAGAATLGSVGALAGVAHSIETYTNQPSTACAGELDVEAQVVDVIAEECLGDLALKTWPGFEYHVSTDTQTVDAQTTETITNEYYVVPSNQDYLNGGLLETDEDMRWPFTAGEIAAIGLPAVLFGICIERTLRNQVKKQYVKETSSQTRRGSYKNLLYGYEEL